MIIKTIGKRIIIPFKDFLSHQQASGIILIICTLISLFISNTGWGEHYMHFWHEKAGFTGPYGLSLTLSVEEWINDGLMAIFFLVVGLEIKRELLKGELSTFKKASLPFMAALGGMLIPALIYILLNKNTDTVHGWGVPMATDIAFALGILSLAGNKAPFSLKVFLTALAVIDDLGAILVIAIFYSQGIVLENLGIAFVLYGLLWIFNLIKINNLIPYTIVGVFMWYFMLQSGIHATIAGVLLATTIPLKTKFINFSPLENLEHTLHSFSSFIIMPLFALANTCIVFNSPLNEIYTTSLSMGIILGLFVGKPVGIFLFSYLAVKTRLADLPSKANFFKIFSVGFLGGIGFTMSIFISILAFDGAVFQTNAKISVLTASFLAGLLGYLLLKLSPSDALVNPTGARKQSHH